MYKVRDKFIIEIGEKYETTALYISQIGEKSLDTPNNLYRIKGFNSLVFDENGLDKLVPLDKCRPSWYDEIYSKGYEAGSNDAWRTAKRIVCSPCNIGDDSISNDELNQIFHTYNYDDILSQFSPSVAIEKIKMYEEQEEQKKKDELKVGDEVYILDRNYPYIVTSVDSLGYISFFSQNGKWGGEHKSKLKKTGRHFPQIAEVLKQMQEVEE